MDMNCLAVVCYFGSLFLSVASNSASDTKFQVLQNESTTFYVRWSSTFPPNESAVFRVTVGQMFDAECRKPLKKGNFFCRIGDRLPNTQYLLQLWICPPSSESTDTCHNASNTVTAYTTPQAPTTANATARNNETIEVMWQTPSQNLNDLMTLIVLYGGDSPQTLMQTTESGPHSVKFTNLTALTAYNATLVINNINNNYISSTVYTRTVLTFPNAPTIISILDVGSTWIKALIKPAAGSETFDLRYVLSADGPPFPKKECVAQVMPEGLVCNVTGLASETLYSLTAKACHNEGCSVPSSPVTQTTTESKNLSSGAIVGIVIGVLFGCILLFFLGYLIYLVIKSKHGSLRIQGVTTI